MKTFTKTDPVPVVEVMPLIAGWRWGDDPKLLGAIFDLADTDDMSDDVAARVCETVNGGQIPDDAEPSFTKVAKAAMAVLDTAEANKFKRFPLGHRRNPEGKLEFCFMMTVNWTLFDDGDDKTPDSQPGLPSTGITPVPTKETT